MSKTILLPLDGSALADRARPYAVALARRTGGRIVLMEAVALKTLPHEPTTNADMKVMDKADKFLTDVEADLIAQGINAQHHELFEEPAEAILDAAVRYSVDLVVMATHGRSGIGRMLYGSVADQVLREAEVPVLLVPAHINHAWPSDQPLNILVPLDGSPLAEEALASALLLSEAFPAKIHLLRVVEPPAYPLYGDGYAYIPYDEEADLSEARRYIEDRAATLRGRGLDVSATVLVGTAGRTIEAYARDETVDVIAMATHGLSGVGRLVLGSVATDVLRRGIAPVLLVRPANVPNPLAEVAPPAFVEESPIDAGIDATAERVRTLEVQAEDLHLIVRGLRALGHQPGTEYAEVAAAQRLAEALERTSAPEGSLTATSR